MKIELWVQV